MSWHYSNTSVETSVTLFLSSVDNHVTVSSSSGFPVSFPYSLTVDYGQSTREVVSVNSAVGNVLAIDRAQDGTSASDHSVGAVVVHTVVARDLSEPQTHIAASVGVHGLGGGAALVGTTTTQTLTGKAIDGTTNTITNVAGSNVIGNIDAQQLVGDLEVDSAIVTGRTTTGTLTVNGVDITGAWTAYTPALSSSSGSPTVGNGTLVGQYKKLGTKTVDVRAILTRGSTTSFGTGFIAISLPAGMTALDLGHAGGARLGDVSANSFSGSCIISDDSTKIVPLSASGVITSTVPFTWATGDIVVVQMRVELA